MDTTLSPKQVAGGIAHAEARYLARLSPGRRGSLTTVALRLLFAAVREDFARIRGSDSRRPTPFTRHSLREAVRAYPDLRRKDFLSASFNTTPEELAELLTTFSHEETVDGRSWRFTFAGPTRTARGGEGAKEELYLTVTITSLEKSASTTEASPAVDDGVSAEAPSSGSLLDRYRAIWTSGLSRADSIHRSQALLRDLNVLKFVYLSEDVTLEIGSDGDGMVEQRIRAVNVGAEPIACESHEIWLRTSMPIGFPLTVSSSARYPPRLERQRDFPNYQQFTLHFPRPIRPGQRLAYAVQYPCREFSTDPTWDLKTKRFINRLRLIVRDRRPGRLTSLSLATESGAGLTTISNPPIDVTVRRGVTRLVWTQTFPEVDWIYRFGWQIG